MWNSALSDKHFKTQKAQYIHKFIEDHLFDNLSESWLLQLGSGVAMLLLGCTFSDNGAKYLCLCFTVPAGFFSASIITIVAQSISNIFYRPPSSRGDEIILINPDGNPEMCKMTDYPAIDFYGYRLPNAGDIGKIAFFEEQRQKEEERAEKERQDEFNKTTFVLFLWKWGDIWTFRSLGDREIRGFLCPPEESLPVIYHTDMIEIVKKSCEAKEFTIGPNRAFYVKGTAIEKIQKFLKSA